MQHTSDNDTDVSWLDDAACAALPIEQLELFFVRAGVTIDASTLALCQGCAVRVQCLEHARRHEIANGYFGGVSPTARRAAGLHPHGTSRR